VGEGVAGVGAQRRWWWWWRAHVAAIVRACEALVENYEVWQRRSRSSSPCQCPYLRLPQGRPTHFLLGNTPFVFGINFTAGETMSYRVIAANGPNSLVTVNQNTPCCNKNEPRLVCSQRCEAKQAPACGWNVTDRTRDCLSNYRSWRRASRSSRRTAGAWPACRRADLCVTTSSRSPRTGFVTRRSMT
jgi:hypothetical protein